MITDLLFCIILFLLGAVSIWKMHDLKENGANNKVLENVLFLLGTPMLCIGTAGVSFFIVLSTFNYIKGGI